MAKSDEEKVKQFENAGGVEAKADETPAEESTNPTEEESQAVETAKEEPNSDETEETPEPLTKPYDWLKGSTPEEWVEELKTAYENSTNEALRLKQTPSTPVEAPAPPAPADPNAGVIAQMQAYLQSQTIQDFDKFAKGYPQAREPGEFDKFTKASQGAYQALTDILGRAPTNPELFENIAKLLNWQASDKTARKDQALKDSGASPSTVSSSKAVKSTNVTEAELAVAERFFPTQSREDILKGLAAVKK